MALRWIEGFETLGSVGANITALLVRKYAVSVAERIEGRLAEQELTKSDASLSSWSVVHKPRKENKDASKEGKGVVL